MKPEKRLSLYKRDKRVSQLSWLEHYTDNVGVGGSSPPETTGKATDAG